MKAIATLVMCSLLASGFVADAASPSRLSNAARYHVSRFSDALTSLQKNASGRRENYAGDQAIALLVMDKSSAGDEALAALTGYYLGESTEPECEVLARGAKMIPWLRRFMRRPPVVRLQDSTVNSRSEVLSQIQAGIQCE